MTPDDAFLADIIESPDDDAPRLIYADYLDERGDPRGEFIRVQCELARTPEGDARRELEARERGLLEAHGEEWLGPLHALVNRESGPRGYRYRRGFVEEVTVSAADFLRRGDTLFRAHPVRRVTLRRVGAMPLLGGSPHLARLSHLDLEFWDGAPFAVQYLRALLASPHLGGLRGLGVSGAHLGLAGVRALVASPLLARLSRLELGGAGLDARAVGALTASPSLGGLARLDLGKTPSGSAGCGRWRPAPTWPGWRRSAWASPPSARGAARPSPPRGT